MYPRRSWEELEGKFLGLMAYLNPKGAGDSSMPVKRQPGPGVRDGVSRDPRDMAKLRREALCCIPDVVGRDAEEGP